MQSLRYFVYLSLLLLPAASIRTAVAQETISPGVRFEVEKNSFRQSETIKASFINGSAVTIYVVTPNLCGQHPIQKLTDKGWSYISFPDRGFLCASMVGYWPVPASTIRQLSYSPHNIREMTNNNPLGIYRFVWAVAPKDHGNSEAVVSQEFQIIE
jgi:hypothetical protein